MKRWKTQKSREMFHTKKGHIREQVNVLLDHLFAICQNDVPLSDEDIERFLQETEHLEDFVSQSMLSLRSGIHSRLTEGGQ